MNCCILIMGCNKQPSIRNVDMMFDTFVKFYNDNEQMFNHNYHFIQYKGGYDKVELNNNTLYLTSPDDISSSYNKTLEAFEYIYSLNKYDYIIRINISTFINMFALDTLISNANSDIIYCNAVCSNVNSEKFLNTISPRGDAYIFHKSILEKIINISKNYNPQLDNINGIENVDDVMLGLLLLKIFNNQLHNHIQLLNYNFVPYNIINQNEYKMCVLFVFTRLKTCPPNTLTSDYSWSDNEYRKYDIIKLKAFNDYINTNKEFFKSYKFNINNLLCDDREFPFYTSSSYQ